MNHSRASDVTTDYGFGRGFYTLDGDTVLRYLCPPHVINLNRANCNAGVQRLYLWGVQDYVRKLYGEDLGKYDDEVIQYLIKIDRIDAQLRILLDVEPDHNPDLLPQINSLIEQIAEVDAVITELKNQKIQIASQLDQHEDPDLRAIYDSLELKLAKQGQKKDQLVQSLMNLRKQYYDDNAAILTNETYKRLINQRALAVNNYEYAQENLKVQLDEVLAFHTAMKFLNDSTTWDFVFTDRDKTAAVVNSIGNSFNHYFSENSDRIIRSYWSDDSKFQVLANPVIGSRLKQIDFINTDVRSCTYQIESERFSVTTSHAGSATIDHHPPELDPLFNEKIDGHWIIHETCSPVGMHARPIRIYYKM